MTTFKRFSALTGSERQPVRGARVIGDSHPEQTLEVSIRLRSKLEAAAGDAAKTEAARHTFRSALEKPGYKRMKREEFENEHGADPADVEKLKEFAGQYGLKVMSADLARRTMVLSGTVSAFQKAFNVQLKEYSYARGNFRGRVGDIQIPNEYAGIIRGIFGLDNRPQAEPHFRRLEEGNSKIKAHAASQSHDPNELATVYNFPPGDGTGQCIGIIELGGGYRLDDLKNYFAGLNIELPQVITVSVDGGTNSPSDANSADGEVLLDIEVAGAIAPKAKIVVYFAPNTDRGFLDAITTAVHDNANNPSIISISWGSAESQWTQQALTNFDEAFQAAAAMGVTICVASGDHGSSDGVNDGKNHVDFPASSSFVLGCGGTTLQTSQEQIVQESVWNDQPNGGAGGGGVSDVFPLPTWQQKANVPAPASKGNGGRGVPDVAGDADPNTGYNVLVDGQALVFGGTSAVAPLWAGLLARINQNLGQTVGFVNPVIYGQDGSSGFHDITQGNNGDYKAAKGWDPCTGQGSPDGVSLQTLLGKGTSAAAA